MSTGLRGSGQGECEKNPRKHDRAGWAKVRPTAPAIMPPAGKRAVPDNIHARHSRPGFDGHASLGASRKPPWSGFFRGISAARCRSCRALALPNLRAGVWLPIAFRCSKRNSYALALSCPVSGF